jgi:hypothetical protein
MINGPRKKYLVLAAGTERISFSADAVHAGLYYLEFQAELSVAGLPSMEKGKELMKDLSEPLVWDYTAFVRVK